MNNNLPIKQPPPTPPKPKLIPTLPPLPPKPNPKLNNLTSPKSTNQNPQQLNNLVSPKQNNNNTNISSNNNNVGNNGTTTQNNPIPKNLTNFNKNINNNNHHNNNHNKNHVLSNSLNLNLLSPKGNNNNFNMSSNIISPRTQEYIRNSQVSPRIQEKSIAYRNLDNVPINRELIAKFKCKILSNFDAVNIEDITLREGDIVIVYEENDENFYGENTMTKKFGYFPKINMIKELIAKKIPPLPPPMNYEKAMMILKKNQNNNNNNNNPNNSPNAPSYIPKNLYLDEDEDEDDLRPNFQRSIDVTVSATPKVVNLSQEVKNVTNRQRKGSNATLNSISTKHSKNSIILNIIMPDFTHSSIFVQKKSTVKEAIQKICMKRQHNPLEYGLSINKKGSEILLSYEQSIGPYKNEDIYLTKLKTGSLGSSLFSSSDESEIIEDRKRSVTIIDNEGRKDMPVEQMNENELFMEKESILLSISSLSHQLNSLNTLFENISENEKNKEANYIEGKKRLNNSLDFYKQRLLAIDSLTIRKKSGEDIFSENPLEISTDMSLKEDYTFSYFQNILDQQQRISVKSEFWRGNVAKNNDTVTKTMRYYYSLINLFLESFEMFSIILDSVENKLKTDFISSILKLFESQSCSVNLIKSLFHSELKLFYFSK